MYVLEVDSLQLVEFANEPAGEYAILSHRWRDAEVLFADMADVTSCEKLGLKKVRKCCELSASEGLRYCWVDTCCIDKKSSSELSEAINSMFRWYQNSSVCYVYLDDVHSTRNDASFAQDLAASSWFTRCWTLQELLAPANVRFYNSNWQELGSKTKLVKELASITGIDAAVLGGDDLSHYSVAQRMAWASQRQATRLEDLAYSLLGIFEITMPMLYGEGLGAFQRLQEAILESSTDASIFAWQRSDGSSETSGLLAPSPLCFSGCHRVVSADIYTPWSAWAFSSVEEIARQYKDAETAEEVETATRAFQKVASASLVLVNNGIRGTMLLASIGGNPKIAFINAVKLDEHGSERVIGVYLNKLSDGTSNSERVSSKGEHLWLGSFEDMLDTGPRPYKIFVPHKGSSTRRALQVLSGIWLTQKIYARTYQNRWELLGAMVEIAPGSKIGYHNDEEEVIKSPRFLWDPSYKKPADYGSDNDGRPVQITERTRSRTRSRPYGLRSMSESSGSNHDQQADTASRPISPFSCNTRYISLEHKYEMSGKHISVMRPKSAKFEPLCNIHVDGACFNIELIHVGIVLDIMYAIIFHSDGASVNDQFNSMLEDAKNFSLSVDDVALSTHRTVQDDSNGIVRSLSVVEPYDGVRILAASNVLRDVWKCDRVGRENINRKYKSSFGWEISIEKISSLPKTVRKFELTGILREGAEQAFRRRTRRAYHGNYNSSDDRSSADDSSTSSREAQYQYRHRSRRRLRRSKHNELSLMDYGESYYGNPHGYSYYGDCSCGRAGNYHNTRNDNPLPVNEQLRTPDYSCIAEKGLGSVWSNTDTTDQNSISTPVWYPPPPGSPPSFPPSLKLTVPVNELENIPYFNCTCIADRDVVPAGPNTYGRHQSSISTPAWYPPPPLPPELPPSFPPSAELSPSFPEPPGPPFDQFQVPPPPPPPPLDLPLDEYPYGLQSPRLPPAEYVLTPPEELMLVPLTERALASERESFKHRRRRYSWDTSSMDTHLVDRAPKKKANAITDY